MENISGFGLVVSILASNSFPVGLLISDFADDSDPFDFPVLQIGDSGMGLNGDLVVWQKPNPIKVTLNVIPGSFSDINLAILLEANRTGKNKSSARDVITMTGIYPSGNIVVLENGFLTDGMPASSVASAGRLKTKPYSFSFENRVGGL